MPKQGEVNYVERIGESGRSHIAGKPISDENCGGLLTDMGCLITLLPSPPARILDLGVGSGWTSMFLGRRGYDVVGQDI